MKCTKQKFIHLPVLFLCGMVETELVFAGKTFVANLLKTLYDPQNGLLLIADCHFGKATHFRKHNIPLPQTAALADYHNLHKVLEHYKPRLCCFLGDLFHSAGNKEWQWLSFLLKEHKGTHFVLVQGNHDILPADDYVKAGFDVVPEYILDNRMLLTHEPVHHQSLPYISGHIHPGFTLRGRARQHVTLPCYYLTGNCLIMPAFGTLTGMVNMVKRSDEGRALCIAGQEMVWVAH